ncbi:hypothetical protein ACKVV1_010950 [Pyricularia oryzae]
MAAMMQSPNRRRSMARQYTARSSRHLNESMEDVIRLADDFHPNRDVEQAVAHVNEPEVEKMGRPRTIIVVILLLTCLLFSLLDTTIVSTSLLETSKDLGNVEDISWIMLAYLLTYMGFSIIFAKLSDIFGRLAMLEISWLIFALFSLGCGISQTMTQLIVMRAFQGIGGAGLYSLPFICIHEVVPANKWHLMGASIACMLSVSYVLGPILGGVIPHLSSWRVLHLMNVPIAGAVAGGLFVVYPRKRHQPKTSVTDKLRQMDFVGAVLLLAASMMIVYCIQEGGSMKLPWSSPTIVTMLVISSLCWVAFWCWEASVGLRDDKVEPIFPLSLAGHRAYLACLFATFLLGFVFMTSVVVLPERSQVVDGRDVLMAGVDLLPLLAAVAVGTFASVPFTRPKNRTTLSLTIGASLMTAGCSLMTAVENMEESQAINAVYGFKVILGLGFGFCLSSTTVIANVIGRGADMAVANGAIAQARVLGSAIGLGMWTIIFNRHARSNSLLVDQRNRGLLTPQQVDMLHRAPSNALLLQGPAREEVRQIYTASFTDIMLVLAIVSSGAFAMALCTYQTNPPPVNLPSLPTTSPRPRARLPKQMTTAVTIDDYRGTRESHDRAREGNGSESDGRLDSIELGRMPTLPLAILPK